MASQDMRKVTLIRSYRLGRRTVGLIGVAAALPARGRTPRIVELVGAGNPVSEDEVLRLAASAKDSSEHPVAQAVVDAAKEHKLALVDATDFHPVPGHGLDAMVDGRVVLVGNAKHMRDRGIDFDGLGSRAADLEGAGRTVVRVAVDGKARGLIAIADAVHPSAKETIDRLHNLGIQVAMLTGVNRATAEPIASELGLHTVFAEALPRSPHGHHSQPLANPARRKPVTT